MIKRLDVTTRKVAVLRSIEKNTFGVTGSIAIKEIAGQVRVLKVFKINLKLNIMITEDYVNYEIARLLENKGFDEHCYACYEYFKSSVTLYQGWMFEYKGHPVRNSHDRVKCPTLQLVMKWLREIHHIDICVCRVLDKYGKCYDGYMAVVYQNGCYKSTIRDAVEDLTYEKVSEEAIKYSLTLI